MYKLLRPHHSLFLLDNEKLCANFIQLAKDNSHIALLLSESSHDLLLQWRLAFNTWIYLRSDEDYLYEDNENVMIYPTVQYLISLYKKYSTIAVFKNNYHRDELLVFIASIFLANECINWFEDTCNTSKHEYREIATLLQCDYYQVFQMAKNGGPEYFPTQLTLVISSVFKEIKEKSILDETYISHLFNKAVHEAKKMNNFLLEEGVC